jgi:cytochrome c peroxidase
MRRVAGTRRAALALAAALACAPAALLPAAAQGPGAAAADWDWRRDAALPAWAPPPVDPPDNPMSRAKVALGRRLFHDTRLSADGRMACATCHVQARGFADPRRVAIGADGSPGLLNPPGLANVAYLPVLTWANPGQVRLEEQALIPLFSQHPVELGMAGREAALFGALAADPDYPAQFRAAFPEREGAMTLETLTKALAAFQRSILSFRSPYDRYRWGGDRRAISAAARRGEALFFGERLECYHCHGGPTFTDTLMHAWMAEPERGFHVTGVARTGGIGEQTGRVDQRGAFRTPSLRNVALTAPYMHDGSLPTLADVLRHYERGGIRRGPHTSPLLRGFRLTARERADLIAFLDSLTDPELARDARWSDPAAAPTRR